MGSGASGAYGKLDTRLFHTVRHSQAKNDRAMDGSDAMNRGQFVAENGQPTQSGLPKALRFTLGPRAVSPRWLISKIGLAGEVG